MLVLNANSSPLINNPSVFMHLACVTVTKVFSDMFSVALGMLINTVLLICIVCMIRYLLKELEEETVIDWDSVRVTPGTLVETANPVSKTTTSANRAERNAIFRGIINNSERKLYAIKASMALKLVSKNLHSINEQKSNLLVLIVI